MSSSHATLTRVVENCARARLSSPAHRHSSTTFTHLVVYSPMTGYLIHSHRYISTEPTHRFWDIQAQIVTQLRLIRALTMVVAFVHPDHDCRAVGINFTQRLRSDGWVLSNTTISFPSFGDSVSGSCRLIVAIHSNAEVDCRAFEIKTSPQIKPKPIA